MDVMIVAALTFIAVVGTVAGAWGLWVNRDSLRQRLTSPRSMEIPPSLLRTQAAESFPLLARLAQRVSPTESLKRLAAQAGWSRGIGFIIALILLSAAAGMIIGGVRLGGAVWALACGVAGGVLPIVWLRIRRARRLDKFSEQLPEALDLMTRSLRAGHAFSSALQVVAEEMPEPSGPEFRRAFDEVSMGGSPDEALSHLHARVTTEDLQFLYVAVALQREVGGNLAEILEKLSEVIRERFKLLSFAKVISSQQKGSAWIVALVPFFMVLVFSLISPGFYDPLFDTPTGRFLTVLGLGLQLIGALVLRRIANIRI